MKGGKVYTRPAPAGSVDPVGRRSYSGRMANDDARVDSTDLKILESRIDELIEACRRLKNENHSLKSDQNNLSEQHARLMEKTRHARARIETMIDRLKALERS